MCASASSVRAVSSNAVTVSDIPMPNMAPKLRPNVPTAHGAPQDPSGNFATTKPVPTRSPPIMAILAMVRNKSPRAPLNWSWNTWASFSQKFALSPSRFLNVIPAFRTSPPRVKRNGEFK